MIKLLEKEQASRKEQPHEGEDFDDDNNNGGNNVVAKVVVEEQPIDYYYSYYDPFYVSPLWLL
jgi:hypothetical protein